MHLSTSQAQTKAKALFPTLPFSLSLPLSHSADLSLSLSVSYLALLICKYSHRISGTLFSHSLVHTVGSFFVSTRDSFSLSLSHFLSHSILDIVCAVHKYECGPCGPVHGLCIAIAENNTQCNFPFMQIWKSIFGLCACFGLYNKQQPLLFIRPFVHSCSFSIYLFHSQTLCISNPYASISLLFAFVVSLSHEHFSRSIFFCSCVFWFW